MKSTRPCCLRLHEARAVLLTSPLKSPTLLLPSLSHFGPLSPVRSALRWRTSSPSMRAHELAFSLFNPRPRPDATTPPRLCDRPGSHAADSDAGMARHYVKFSEAGLLRCPTRQRLAAFVRLMSFFISFSPLDAGQGQARRGM